MLVTGAAGFIGAHIAEACRRGGWCVTGVDIRPSPRAVQQCDRWLTASTGTAGVLRDIAAGRYQAVVHQAAITDTTETNAMLLAEVNVVQPLAIADACTTGGACLVYASSHSVYGKICAHTPLVEEAASDSGICTGPVNHYARSKLELDTAMATRLMSPLHWVGLRYTNVFGRGEGHKGSMASIISQLLRLSAYGKPLNLFDDTLDACRDYIPVESVTSTVLSLLEQEIPSGVYNLGSGIPVSFSTLVKWCGDFAGKEQVVRLRPNPIPGQYQYWTCADMNKLERVLPSLPKLTTADIKSSARRLCQFFMEAQMEGCR